MVDVIILNFCETQETKFCKTSDHQYNNSGSHSYIDYVLEVVN